MAQLGAFLHGHPALCLFLSILLGGFIGRFHFKGVGFGSVVGTLLAGICVGIVARPELPDLLRWVFFYLFLFAIGYSIGPQLFGGLKKAAVPQMMLALVVAVSGVTAVIAVSAVFGFNEGLAVGLLSGGMTQSAALGTGLSAIAELPIPDAAKQALMADAPLGDAITYLFGDLGLILFFTWLGPKIMGVDLRAEAKALERQLSGGKDGGPVFSAAHYSLRAHRIENAETAASNLAALEERFAAERLSVRRVQRDGELLPLHPTLALKSGDLVVVSARRGAFLHAERDIGPEIEDASLLSVPMQTAAVVVTSADVNGRTLLALAQDPRTRGVYLESLQRGTESIPREPWTVLQRGDILRLVGEPADVERAATHIGFVERDPSQTDLTFLAGGIGAGILFGLLRLDAGGVVIGLGTSGAILVMGRSPAGPRPLPGVRRDTRAGTAADDGRGSHRVHRRGRPAGGASRRRGLSHERRLVLRERPGRGHDRHDRAPGRRHHRRALRAGDEPAHDAGWSRWRPDLPAGFDRAAGGERQQRRLAGLYRALRRRHHPAHRVGADRGVHRARDANAMKRGFDVLHLVCLPRLPLTCAPKGVM
jgi:putative transport protein